MSIILRQSTQIVVRIGVFVDVGDGFTPETGVTLSGADEAEVLKAAGAATASIAAATWAAISGADGWYDLTLTTSLTDTLGELIVVVNDDSVCLPVFQRFFVVEEAIYDALYAASARGAFPDISDIESSLVIVKSDLIVIDDLASDVHSSLVISKSQILIIKSDTSDVISTLVKVYSDTTAVHSDTTAVHSDTTAIHTLSTKIDSDQASQYAILEPYISDTISDTAAIHSQTTKILSDTTAVHSDTTAIHTLATKVDSDQASQFVIVASQFVVLEQNTSDTESALVKVYSDTTAIEAAGGGLTATQASQLTRVQSDSILAEGNISDIESALVKVYSDTTKVESQALVLKSDASDIRSALVVIASDAALLEGSHAEPTGVPSATASPLTKLGVLYMALRNKVTVTATKKIFYDDSEAAEFEKDLSDDGVTYQETKLNAP